MTDDISQKVYNFFSKATTQKFQKGETIVRNGDDPKGVYFLKKGYVRVYTLSTDGVELTLNIFKPGSYFPVTWLITGFSNHYTYQAMTSVLLHRSSKREVMKFLNDNQEVFSDMNKRLISGLNGTMARMEHIVFGNAYLRVISALVMMASRFGKKVGDNEIQIDIRLTHQEIANLAGLARETATVELNRLMKEKMIRKEGLFIHLININQLNETLANHFSSKSTFSYYQ